MRLPKTHRSRPAASPTAPTSTLTTPRRTAGANATGGFCAKPNIPDKPAKNARAVPAPTVSLAVKNARAFLRAGYSIIPLQSHGKAPLNPGGFNRPISDATKFARYADKHPSLNYGIVTGAENGIVVIDVDGSVGDAHLKELEVAHGALPTTVIVLTAKGRHIYFTSENLRLRSKVGWAPKLDFRANGGYVVGPGCVHASGKHYGYADGASPSDTEIATLPKWLEIILLADQASSPPAQQPASRETIDDGQRNVSLTRLAGQLHNTGISGEGLVAALLAENQRKCKPPLPDEEVRKIAASVGQYPAHLKISQDEAENVMGRVLAEHFGNGANLLHAIDGHFWSFCRTHWQVLPTNNLNKVVLDEIRRMPTHSSQKTSSLLAQVNTLLKAHCSKPGDLLRFASDPLSVINCRNGELWIQNDGTVELRAHSPQSYLRHCFNVDYDPKAACPRYDRAVEEIFVKSNEPAQLGLFWDELMGYMMQPARPRPVIVIAQGRGSNGKTALLQLLVQLIGRELVLAVEIQDLERNRFAIGDLDGKLLLLDDDVKAGTRLPDGNLKKVSEAKIITGEHKFGPSFQFTVRTVPFLLCNNPPSIADLSLGLRRRLVVVPFDRIFEVHEIDTGLFRYISATELPGVLNRFLKGLERLVKRDWQFELPEAVKAATEEFVVGANPLPKFIDQECEKTGSIYVKELFSRYESWCQENGITFRQQRLSFSKNLRHLNFEIGHGSKGDKVRGLRWRQ